MFRVGPTMALYAFFAILPVLASASGREDIDNMDCFTLTALERDAEHDDATAQLKLSTLYMNGKCVSQDWQMAGVWLNRSAKAGYAPAQAALAGMFHKARMDAETVQWAQRAAEQGEPFGEGLLAYSFEKGKGVEVDYVEAAKWAKRAAGQGNALGQLILGNLYADGKGGLPNDLIEADKWYILFEKSSKISPEENGIRKLCELHMRKSETLEAKKRADAWQAEPKVQ